MKIGIVTLYGEFNYGNRLQNYALQMILEALGNDVSTIVAIDKQTPIKHFLKKYLVKEGNSIKIRNSLERKREKNLVLIQNLL